MKRNIQAARLQTAHEGIAEAIQTITKQLGIEVPPPPTVKRQSVRHLYEMEYFATILQTIAHATEPTEPTKPTKKGGR